MCVITDGLRFHQEDTSVYVCVGPLVQAQATHHAPQLDDALQRRHPLLLHENH